MGPEPGPSGAANGGANGGGRPDAAVPADGGRPPASALSELAASLAPGEWRELPTTNLDADYLGTNATGERGAHAATDWSDYLVWDAPTQQVLYTGAGHLEPYKFMVYGAADNTWHAPTNLAPCMLLGGYDGCFNHGYHNGTLDVARRRFYFQALGTLLIYDLVADHWEERQLPDNVLQVRGSATVYAPVLDRLVLAGAGSVGVYDPASGRYEEIASGLQMGEYHNTGTYSARHDLFVFGGGNDSPALYAMDREQKIRRLPDAPTVVHVAITTLTTDPITGDVLLLSGGVLYALNLSTSQWREVGRAPGPVHSALLTADTDHHALATPLSDHGVVMFLVPQDPYGVYLYRHAPP
jgi:hypothetical protein